jgi:hypothetical protein
MNQPSNSSDEEMSEHQQDYPQIIVNREYLLLYRQFEGIAQILVFPMLSA